MTTKFDGFIAALRKLCEEHSVVVCNNGYDFLQVWDQVPPEETLLFPDIEDRTKEVQNAPLA